MQIGEFGLIESGDSIRNLGIGVAVAFAIVALAVGLVVYAVFG